ncbi:KH domain-containing protein [Apostasia shenzhenica]|uniref:KH domain-containing protein n=1 Tax=Apostasia shenzhenica TaxID=1088818 RepID=A0A2I0ATN4_9ASPA|nr:KH domain-containing protein [Apostasia shenzhenica]
MAAANTDIAVNGTVRGALPSSSEVQEEIASTQADEGLEAPAEIQDAAPSDEELGATDDGADDISECQVGEEAPATETKKWPGWPGDNVYRLVVPVAKVGGIIGRKGELIKKLCEETRARIRILEGVIGTNDRIVLISAKEELDAEISPAMDAVLRVFKRVSDISESTVDGADQAIVAAANVCSVRLLVASSQAVSLIGKQGAMIKSIQENSGATIRVLSGDELPYYATAEERIVDIHGESLKVLKALEAVVAHFRKFLVDHSVLPLFEKNLKVPAAQDRGTEAWADKTQSLMHSSQSGEYALSRKRDPLYHDRDADSQFQLSSLSLYGQDPALSGLRSSGSGRGPGVVVTQVTQSMQIPLSYAEDIIGIGGGNIAYIRRTSGAVLTVQETRGVPDEITVEIKGSTSQVQKAQQLIMEFISGHKEPVPSSYGSYDTGLGSSYSHYGGSGYSSSLSSSALGGYGGYGSYRL